MPHFLRMSRNLGTPYLRSMWTDGTFSERANASEAGAAPLNLLLKFCGENPLRLTGMSGRRVFGRISPS